MEFNDEEMLQNHIKREFRPPTLGESSLLRKQKRFVSWIANPVTKGKDLDLWHIKCQDSRMKLADLEVRKEDWYVTFEHSRKMVSHGLHEIQHWNRQMKQQVKLLHALCESECNTTAIHTKRGYQVKDMIDELYKRDIEVMERVAQHHQIAEECCETIEITSEEYQNAVAIHAMSNTDVLKAGGSVKDESSSNQVAMEVDEEKPQTSSNVDKKALTKQLQGVFQQLNDALQRMETEEGDIDWFFQDQDELTPIESLLLKDYVKNTPDLIHIKSEHEVNNDFILQNDEKEDIVKAFMSLCEVGQEEKMQEYFHKVFDALDGNNHAANQATMTRKKKAQRTDMIALTAFARSRTESELPLLISPLSCLEDRYLGTLRYGTIFTPAVPSSSSSASADSKDNNINAEKDYYIQSVVPPMIREAEDDVIARCAMQSCAAAATEKIKKLHAAISELTKQVAEGQVALQKSTWAFQVTLNEDLNERNKMKATLATNASLLPDGHQDVNASGFVPFDGTASSSSQQQLTQESMMSIATNTTDNTAVVATNTTSKNGKGGKGNAKNAAPAATVAVAPSSEGSVGETETTSESLPATEEASNGKKGEDNGSASKASNNKRKSGALEAPAVAAAAPTTTAVPAKRRR